MDFRLQGIKLDQNMRSCCERINLNGTVVGCCLVGLFGLDLCLEFGLCTSNLAHSVQIEEMLQHAPLLWGFPGSLDGIKLMASVQPGSSWPVLGTLNLGSLSRGTLSV